MTWELVSGRELSWGVSEWTRSKLSSLGKFSHRFVAIDLYRMMPGALAFCSVVLIMHAVFLVPSVVAVPFIRPANASERAGSCIPGPQSNQDGNRNKVADQSSMGGVSVLLATSAEAVVSATETVENSRSEGAKQRSGHCRCSLAAGCKRRCRCPRARFRRACRTVPSEFAKAEAVG